MSTGGEGMRGSCLGRNRGSPANKWAGIGRSPLPGFFSSAEPTYVVVIYYVTIAAIGHGLLKKFWPLVLGCVLRTAGSSII